jgi:pantoate--beta-alanine ligase
MQLCQTNAELALALSAAREEGKSIGFVPTMGALHEGHLSLIRQSKADGHFTIVSVFVNPLQFGDGEDFDSYPRTLGVDARLVTDTGGDVLYAPTPQAVFPEGAGLPEPDPGELGDSYEGAARPGHFAGVLKVVSRLLDLVSPDALYLGQKDAQQVALIRRMVTEQLESGMRQPVSVVVMPTIRDDSGLAMSSRNRRLSEAELEIARTIYPALVSVAASGKDASAICELAKAALSPEARLDYLEVVDEQFEKVQGKPPAGSRLIVAANVGSVRLIDNVLIGGE